MNEPTFIVTTYSERFNTIEGAEQFAADIAEMTKETVYILTTDGELGLKADYIGVLITAEEE